MTAGLEKPAASPQPAAPVAIDVREVRVRYAGVVAVDGVSLRARPGEVLALIGPNGAGKTSLFDAISGVRPPDGGVVLLDGRDVTRASATRRSRLGLRRTFQRQQVFGGLSVADNVLAACEWAGGGGGIVGDMLALPGRRSRERRRRAEVEEFLELTGLTPVRNTPAGVLPIGRARMLELARALAGRPSVLLLDEPTSGLGEAEVELLARIVESVKAEARCAIVLIEHDISFVMRHADRVAVLVRGALIAEGTPAQIRDDARVRAAYLD